MNWNECTYRSQLLEVWYTSNPCWLHTELYWHQFSLMAVFCKVCQLRNTHVLMAFSVFSHVQTDRETLNGKLSNNCEIVCLITANKYGAGELLSIFCILHSSSVWIYFNNRKWLMVAGKKTVLSLELPPVRFAEQNEFSIASTQNAAYCHHFTVIANAV